MLEQSPKKLSGPWKEGYALDMHVRKSTFLGYNEYGHPTYDTERTEIGELLYQLKYHADRTVVDTLAECAAQFVKKRGWKPDLV